MTATESLIAFLCAIYLSDCWYFVPHRAVVFASPLLSTWHWTRTRAWLGTPTGGWVLLRPLPPLGRHSVCDHWPLAVTPECAVGRDTVWAPLGRDRQVLLPISVESAGRVSSDGRRILAGTVEIARVASNRAARSMAGLLRELGAQEPEQREQHIRRAVAAGFDTGCIEQRRAELARLGAPVLVACNALFVYLVAIVPGTLWWMGIERTWFVLLAILAGLQCWILMRFARAHGRLHADHPSERRAHLFQMLLSPPLAVRAHDALSRDVFAEFHPLAVAAVLTPGAAFEELARMELRESRFGRLRVSMTEPARAARTWFDALVFEHAARLTADSGARPADMLAAPVVDPGALAHCPICHTQFTVEQGVCEDCGGIPLISAAVAART